ncbi:MAG: SRPBCC family protein [Myxococcota bacterium]
MARVIRSPRARVWRALVTPAELIRWDTRRTSLDAPAPDHPRVGEAVLWRVALGSVTLPLREEPLEVIEQDRLRSEVALGSFRFEETYSLHDEPMGTTRLSLSVSAKNSMPMLGGELDRFDVRRLATERIDASLEQLQAWCEKGAGAAQMCNASGTQRSGEEKRSRSKSERSIAP